MITLSILLMVLSIVQAGPEDTVDDLKVALGNLDLNHSFFYAPVETVEARSIKRGVSDRHPLQKYLTKTASPKDYFDLKSTL